MKIKSVRGTHDILPGESAFWQKLENGARRIFSLYGFKEIRTPALEPTELFARSLGEESDVVGKEMYTFAPETKESLTLRPEGTAGIVRSAIEHNLFMGSPALRLYYLGPMFRKERPQKGRYRQFHQIGAECIGSESPLADADMLAIQIDLLQELKIEGLTTEINSIGCNDDNCRPRFRNQLVSFLKSKSEHLCSDCMRRIDTNPLRVFDCKKENCRKAITDAPSIADYLCDTCRDHHGKLKGLLDANGVDYVENPRIVRGLDYYTRTVWEISSSALGSQSAVSAGGRYDDLVEQLGGPKTPAVGFAMGVERLLLLLSEEQKQVDDNPDLFFVVTEGLEANGAQATFRLAREARKAGLRAVINYDVGSMKSSMKKANKSGAGLVAIIGEEELKAEEVTLKDMATGEQRRVRFSELVEVAGGAKDGVR
jgi:histidyl-tRNA synthetase